MIILNRPQRVAINTLQDKLRRQGGIEADFVDESFQTHELERLAGRFTYDPLPKIILSSKGIVLAKNIRADQVIDGGIVSLQESGQLEYGSSDLNAAVKAIFQTIKNGRASCKRLLKQVPNGGWIVLEFSKAESREGLELLLTIDEQNICRDESLEALSKGFGFTMTETDVVRHMSQAFCPKEIAAEMGISVNTVRAHLRSIYSKTGVRGYNRALRLILELT